MNEVEFTMTHIEEQPPHGYRWWKASDLEGDCVLWCRPKQAEADRRTNAGLAGRARSECATVQMCLPRSVTCSEPRWTQERTLLFEKETVASEGPAATRRAGPLSFTRTWWT